MASSSHRRSDPDGGAVLDADRGSSSTSAKLAQFTPKSEASSRAEDRAGLRELDAMTESMPGLSRQQKDRARITPRETNAALGHPRMGRTLPGPLVQRAPLSSRQKKARSKTRRAITDRLPQAQYDAQRGLVTRPQRWSQLNDALSDAAGDVEALSESDQRQVRRVDRSIQAYERANDRGHVVYANVQMPGAINYTNLLAFSQNSFRPGEVLAFDRYTAAAHQLHEVSGPDPAGRVAVFEIQTRRGAYLGGSDSADNTGHLLPRGMRLEVVDVHSVSYSRPDGTAGRRIAIRLIDTTPDDD